LSSHPNLVRHCEVRRQGQRNKNKQEEEGEGDEEDEEEEEEEEEKDFKSKKEEIHEVEVQSSYFVSSLFYSK
jgi:hypothetical protein